MSVRGSLIKLIQRKASKTDGSEQIKNMSTLKGTPIPTPTISTDDHYLAMEFRNFPHFVISFCEENPDYF